MHLLSQLFLPDDKALTVSMTHQDLRCLSQFLTTGKTVLSFIFLFTQYSDSNHSMSFFAPLLVLHPPQHLTMFAAERRSSLSICSQVALFLGTPRACGYSFSTIWQ